MQNKRRGRIPQSAWPDILKRHNDGETLSSIARDFDCTPSAISYVLKKAAGGDSLDLDGDDGHDDGYTPPLDTSTPHDNTNAAPEGDGAPAQPGNPSVSSANEPQGQRREEWRDERRPTMRLSHPNGERGPSERNVGERNMGERPQANREQWQPRDGNRDQGSETRNDARGDNRGEGRGPRNFEPRGDGNRRDENRRDDGRRDESRRDEQRPRMQAPQQSAPQQPTIEQRPQQQPAAPVAAQQPAAGEYRPAAFRAPAAEEANDTPVIDVDTRIDTGAGQLRTAYAAWRGQPSPETLDALQTAVHETRKVLARIEIDIAAARVNDPAPRPNFRHSYRAAHR
jgi:hypothetical protein